MENLIQEISKILKSLDETIDISEEKIKIVVNRVRVYLNRKDIPFILCGTIAEIIVEQHEMKAKNNEDVVSSISDHGQSISFSNKVFDSLISKTDVELFASHTSILNRFRKVGVIGVDPFKDD